MHYRLMQEAEQWVSARVNTATSAVRLACPDLQSRPDSFHCLLRRDHGMHLEIHQVVPVRHGADLSMESLLRNPTNALPVVDAGTRVARYVLQELLGKVNKNFSNTAWLPGNLITTFFVVLGWGYLIYTGTISTIWPLFGTGNQLLATIALSVCTTFLINMGKARYAWITAIPMCFIGITTVTAGVLSILDIFWPLTAQPGQKLTGYLDSALMVVFIVGVILVVFSAILALARGVEWLTSTTRGFRTSRGGGR